MTAPDAEGAGGLREALADALRGDGWSAEAAADTASAILPTVERLLAAHPPEASEQHVEWGVRWPDGSITSCGWMDGPSEGWARKSLLPNERFVNPTQQVGEAVVRRTRTIYADRVTEWVAVDE